MSGFLSVQDVLEALRRRWRIAAGVAFGVFLAAAVATWVQTPVYEASAELLIKFGREFVYRPEVGDTAIVNRDRESVINAEIQILRSYDLVSSVVTGVGLDKLYPDLVAAGDRAVQLASQRFSGNYQALVLPDADVLRVTFRHPDPAMTVTALTLLVDRFREKHLEAFGESGNVQFYEEKVAEYREKLDQTENALKVFQSENHAYLDQGQPVLRQRETLEGDLKTTEGQIAGLREKLRYLEAERAKLPAGTADTAAGDRSPVITEAKANLLKLQLQEQELLANFSESNRQVVNVRKQIELVKRFLEEQEAVAAQTGPRTELATDIVNTQGELKFQEAKRDNLRAQLASLDGQASRLPQMEGRYRDLVRERDAIEANYRSFAQKLEESRVSAQMDQQKIANISVIQAPIAPLAPVSPKRSLNLAIGAFVGLLLGLAAAVVVDVRSRPAPLVHEEAPLPGPVPASSRRD